MKQIIAVFSAILILQPAFAQFQYPASKTTDATDNYFGTTISDPYRWLEDLKNPEVINWFKAQSDYTNTELSKIPNQDKLIKEFQQYDSMRTITYGPNGKAGNKYFYRKRLAGEQISKLYYREGEKGKEILLFDPQNYIKGKTFDYGASPSEDGTKIAMNLSEAGSELGDIRIMDVSTKQFLPDVIAHSSGGFMSGSNSEILYTEYKNYDTHDPQNALNTKYKLHVLGSSVDKDMVIVSAANNPELHILPEEYPSISVFKNSPYIICGKYTVENNQTLYYALRSELKSNKINWKPLTTKADEIRQFYVNGKDIYFLTSKGNPKFKIIKTSFENPDLSKAITITEGNKEWQLSSDYITQSKDYLVYNKTKNELITKSYRYEFKTGLTNEIRLPLKGNVLMFGLTKDDNEVVVANLGWTTPYNFYSYNLATQKLSDGIFHMKLNYPNLQNLVYEEVEIPSWDGTPVPLSIIYDKSKMKKDGSNIAFMQGYGAYGMNAYIPFFDESSLTLLNRGVVIAFAHIRGGGEKGNEWYTAGKKVTKPNTWKDFNACTEWLIKNKYSAAERFGVSGASAGGILIGRAITERPDLYRVAIPKVGCLNSLRMEYSPNGPGNIAEFGTVTLEDEFRALLEMDAYQHIQNDVKYPALLVTTGFNDPRVESYIPAKFAAKMQAKNSSKNPVFLYVDYKAGHFGGSTMEEQFAQKAKEYAFLLWQCNLQEFQN